MTIFFSQVKQTDVDFVSLCSLFHELRTFQLSDFNLIDFIFSGIHVVEIDAFIV